jgi:hypothetical protein
MRFKTLHIGAWVMNSRPRMKTANPKDDFAPTQHIELAGISQGCESKTGRPLAKDS